MTNLATLLPQVLPVAISWADDQERLALSTGAALTQQGIADARTVGVLEPEKIRVVIVPTLPLPADAWLRNVAVGAGLLGPGFTGLTLGYAIFIVHGHLTRRLLTHECRHVHQYEAAGSIAAFLPEYLQQIATVGYDAAPFEVDARAHEIH
ncbi:conserved hypothetical protein (plasmid) [Burkholderia ambifaria MC40-6]|uniref:DUF4157 domain-containing protein n=1 Tax=Burkholderia ambifaria (strain MC40-6) TaxID=398577 RepID=B1Z6Q5_BURA4|nr:hypothetical protein [Burkholderia ambifaria]ACB69132.1 conserved hypothetical protein [Burkholderia ambifaria MC40-6]